MLEKLALEVVSPELYYDLADNLDITTDQELVDIVLAKGDFIKELKIGGLDVKDYK